MIRKFKIRPLIVLVLMVFLAIPTALQAQEDLLDLLEQENETGQVCSRCHL
jgi:hypothetical protein